MYKLCKTYQNNIYGYILSLLKKVVFQYDIAIRYEAGIWTDLVIELLLIRALKSQGGVT